MGEFFADIHAGPMSQLGNGPHGLSDTAAVAALRGADTYDDLLALGKALCYQLRYREAVEVYTRAIALDPGDIRGYRQRAARYLTTLRPKLAEADFLRCRALGGEALDISYRLGLCRYYAGEQALAMEELERCWPLCDDEMGIAVIFWHTLSAWRAGKRPTLLEDHYRPGMQAGHHTAYALAMSAAAGEIPLAAAMARLEREGEDLDFSILGYGLAWLLTPPEREALLRKVLERDGFWIGYAYLAAWNDINGGNDVYAGTM